MSHGAHDMLVIEGRIFKIIMQMEDGLKLGARFDETIQDQDTADGGKIKSIRYSEEVFIRKEERLRSW